MIPTEGVMLVDVPPSLDPYIRYSIGNPTRILLSHIMYNHHRSNHIGAASLFAKSNITIMAHDITKSNLEVVPHPTNPMPMAILQNNY